MARPKKVSDDKVFEAAYRVMGRLGPTQWTLADIGRECGLTAGALVQRFGSKHGLLVTLTSQFADAIPAMFEALRAAHPSPLAALYAYGNGVARLAEGPGGVAHHLGYLQLDLADPDLHQNFLAQARARRSEIEKLVADAVAARDLDAKTDVAALARRIEVTLTGSLFTWAFLQEGSVRDFVRTELETVLSAHVRRTKRR